MTFQSQSVQPEEGSELVIFTPPRKFDPCVKHNFLEKRFFVTAALILICSTFNFRFIW